MVAARRPGRIAAPALALLLTGLLTYVASQHSVKIALAVTVAGPLAYWVLNHHANGYLAAVFIALVLPYWYPHVWLIAPILGVLGLIVGVARPRPRFVDLVVLAAFAWYAASWLLHRQLGITPRMVVQGLLPFQFYVLTRITLTARFLPRLQWVLFAGTTVAATTVLVEAIAHRVIFADPQRYQWGGDSTEVFRPGGIFGGSPAAGIALAALILVALPLLRSRAHPRLVRAALVAMFVALGVTYARTGFIALFAGLIMLAVLLPYRRWVPVALAGLAIGIPMYAVATSTNALNTLAGSKLVNSGLIRAYSNDQRLSLYHLAFPLVADTPGHLLFGRGFNSLEATGTLDPGLAQAPLLVQRGGPHNDYLLTIMEQGLVGLALIVLWLGGSLLLGIRTARRLTPGSDRRLLVAGLTAATLAYLTANFFHDVTHNIVDLSIEMLITGVLVTVCQLPVPSSDNAQAARAAEFSVSSRDVLPEPALLSGLQPQ